jgi:two-component system alkaline phosphatase synthesis response regulator PhoP
MHRNMKNNKTPQIRQSAGTPLQGRESPPQRILVVEDDGDIRRLNAEVLAHSGYHVDAAEDGAVAWDTLQRNRYDLMVTDNDMPKVSGVELLHKLHAADMALPVIMATGQLPEEEFTRHPWLQPAAILIKPYSFKELLEMVRNVLRTTPHSAARASGLPLVL